MGCSWRRACCSHCPTGRAARSTGRRRTRRPTARAGKRPPTPEPTAPQGGVVLQRVLVRGGYGAFGRGVAERLARAGGLDVVVAGRSGARAAEAAAAIAQATGAEIGALQLEAAAITAAEIGQ